LDAFDVMKAPHCVYQDNPKYLPYPASIEERLENQGNVINKIEPWKIAEPHLVLLDKHGMARYVLGYREFSDTIISIQRLRTEYNRSFFHRYTWDPKKETQSSKKFQKELGGIHPSEFILAEFLYLNRVNLEKRITSGQRTPNLSTEWLAYDLLENYRGLISRFFKDVGDKMNFPLNPCKKRVKMLLGL